MPNTQGIATSTAPSRSALTPLTFSLASGVLAFALNGWSLPVFGNTGIIFGGVFSLLVAFTYGPWYGGLAAAIGFSRTIVEWQHWAGFVCYGLEAVVAGWLIERRRWNLLPAVLAYWAVIGLPLVIWTTLYWREVPFPGNGSIIIKYPINGLMAALGTLPLYPFLRPHLPGALPPPPTPSLRQMLFRRFGVLATLPIAALSVVAGHKFDGARRQEAVVRMADYVNDTERVVRQHLDQHRLAIATLMDRIGSSADRSAGRLASELELIRRQYPGFLTLLIADAEGRIVATAAPTGWPRPPTTPDLHIADRAYFRAAAATDAIQVSDVFQGRGLGRDLIVAISGRVRGPDGRIAFVVEGSLSLDGIASVVAASEEGHRDLVLLDRSRHVVVASGGFAHLQSLDRFSVDGTFVPTGQPSLDVYYTDRWNPAWQRKEQYIAGFGEISGYGWRLYLQQPVWESTRAVALFYLSTACWAALAVALALVLALITARELTRPLQSLLTATSQLARDSTAMPSLVTAGAPPEIAQLSNDVHEVALSLRDSATQRDRANATLRELLQNLDAKVLERTAELQKARAIAESASHAKTEFLASVSHELRTPLNVILGMSELLQDPNLGTLTTDQAEFVRNVEESGRHLLALINDILDLSKIEVNRLELAVQPVSISDVCEASLRMVREMAARKHLGLAVEYHQRASSVPADPRRLKQILVNLLTNAAKFTNDGGRAGIIVEETEDPRAVVFTVWDTGIGISVEDRPRLFQPFVQIDSTLSRRYPGTGLGLALVKRMTELHGGSVAIASQPGGGSRFSITLPLGDAAAGAGPRPQDGASAGAAAKRSEVAQLRNSPLILLGEDNAANIALITYYARTRACRITVARTGVEVLERARAEHPDVILMDLNMPEMDGLTATRNLKQDPATRDIPVAFLTAAAMDDDRARCLAAGAAAYLSKPVDLALLTATINQLVGDRLSPPARPLSS